jgi:membrane protease YdiL (CAAX protease family)
MAASEDSPRFAVPRTTYLWLALLLLVQGLSFGRERAATRRDGERLTGAAFEKYVAAESKVRAAFGLSAVERMTGEVGAPGTGAGGAMSERRREALTEAVDDYRDLTEQTNAPNIPRRILILENALGRPLNPALLAVDLEKALAAAGTPPAERKAERTLWSDLYGSKNAKIAPSRVAGYEERIRAMRLRSLEDQALHDLYAAGGDTARAQQFARRQEQRSTTFLFRTAALTLPLFVAFFAGLVFLAIFVLNAWRGRWERVARVATQPQRLPAGDLIDAFVFYLFLVRGLGFVGGVLAGTLLGTPTAHQEVMLVAALQIGTGLAAVAYLAAKARRRGVTLADLGLSPRGALWANIGYGLAGYCAILPLLLALRFLAQLVFRHIPNTAPNPIMPLMVADRDIAGRLIIFVMVAVAAPFFEELFFRGALFSGLRARWGWLAAALASAAIFAVAHPPQDWLPILGLGFGLATLREMRQSLVPGMTAHLIQNTLAYLFLTTLFT